MLGLRLGQPASARLSAVLIGAHPDDIEIGAGGLLLSLAASLARVRYLVLTGSEERHAEARAAAHAFLPDTDLRITLLDLREGHLPAAWPLVKEAIESVARSESPDLVIAPSSADAHQDHRTIGEIVPTVFRDHLYLGYEIPKWDGDLGLGRPGVYCPLADDVARRKVELLHASFPSQKARDWWDDEVFLGLARLRGMECRSRYAEAFDCTKAVVRFAPAAG